MTREEAIAFLQEHQPLPPDECLDQATIDQYDLVRKHFLDHPDEACIPLFLNSFGEGDGLGVYPVIGQVLRLFAPSEVVPHLVRGLVGGQRSVQLWNAEYAADFPDSRLVEPLEQLLANGDYDVKYASIVALEQIHDSRIRTILERALEREEEDDLRELLASVLREVK